MTTPSQTIGPFFHFGLHDTPQLADPGDPGAIRIRGIVRDGDGAPVTDALVETWQANPDGRYERSEAWFARMATDQDGAFELVTVKPGRVDGQAPHIAVSVFARGLLQRLATRIYFPDEADANAADPVLSSIADDADRATLVARAEGDALFFDIHLQGDRQTVFFAV